MLIKYIVFVAVGFFLLVKGADYLVDGACGIARRFHIPEMVIGLTLVAIGTSMPELFVSAGSALKGQADMSIGNVIGSNICNLFLILGLTAVIRPVPIPKSAKKVDIPICVACTILLAVLANTGNIVNRFDGFILVMGFALFIGYNVVVSLRHSDEVNNSEKANKEELTERQESNRNKKLVKDIVSMIGGIVALKIGGDFVVDNATEIAKYFHISEQVIALTIVAIGTSLPELVTSVVAATKGETDIALGNVVGSNICNILLVLGISALLTNVPYSDTYNLQLGILLIGTVILPFFPIIDSRNSLSRSNGLVYLLLYALYTVLLFV